MSPELQFWRMRLVARAAFVRFYLNDGGVLFCLTPRSRSFGALIESANSIGPAEAHRMNAQAYIIARMANGATTTARPTGAKGR